MAENYQHGVRVFELSDGIRPIRTIATAIQGFVATAEDADPLVFPENVPVLLTNTQAAVAKAGTKGTLRKALQAIANQANSVCVVVRVASAVDEAEQTANVIGTVTAEGKYTGLKALLMAKSKLGVQPRIIGAPGLDTQEVTTELAVIAKNYVRSLMHIVGDAKPKKKLWHIVKRSVHVNSCLFGQTSWHSIQPQHKPKQYPLLQ